MIKAIKSAALITALLTAVTLPASAGTNSSPAERPSEPLFARGQQGYFTYRIPALAVTPSGTVLAFAEGRKNSGGDAGKIDLFVRRSTDNGKTWSTQQMVWSDGDNTCGNPCAVVDRSNGTIWLFSTWNRGDDHEKQIIAGTSRDTRRVFALHSTDDGKTWSAPREITSDVKLTNWTWYATGPGNGIQLTRGPHHGRLVIPANHTERIADSTHSLTRSHVFYSDDHGKTWQLGGIEEEKTNESTIAELSDGSLMHNMRSYHKKNRRAVALSKDSGLTWAPVTLDDALIEPVCQASLLRCTWPDTGGKSRLLFSNPASEKREKMTVRVSYDEGATWPAGKMIYDGPAAYSCLCILPDKSVACLFECGKTNTYETISLARFPLNWLEAAKE